MLRKREVGKAKMRERATQPRKPRVAHVTTVDLSLRYLLLNQLQRIQSEGYEVFGISAAGPDGTNVRAWKKGVCPPATARWIT